MSSLSFSRKVAFRYLWARRGEAFITIITVISILGIAIGVAVINIVMAVMTGFESELRSKIVGANSHIVIRGVGGKIEDHQTVSDKILKLGSIESVSPFTYHQGLLRVDNRATGLLIRGIAPGSSGAEQVSTYLDRGTIEDLFNPPEVEQERRDGTVERIKLPGLIIGRELAKSFGLTVGKAITIISPEVGSTPFGLTPRMRRFTITGVYSSGLTEYESGLAYASITEAQRFFHMGEAISGLEVRVTHFEEAPVITKKIMQTLGGVLSGLYAQDWTETNKPLWDAIRLEKKVYFIVLLLIVIMASFSVISTLIMIVLEKRRDIAILRTMGATARSIGHIFRIQGGVIGLLGTVLGLVLGFIGCIALKRYGFPLDERIFQMTTVPVRMEPLNFLIVGVSAFLISFLATFYPAKRASALEPSEVLRYE